MGWYYLMKEALFSKVDEIPYPYLKLSPEALQFSILKTRADRFSSSNFRYLCNVQEGGEYQLYEADKERDAVTDNALRILAGTFHSELESMIIRKDLLTFNPDDGFDFIIMFQVTENELLLSRFNEVNLFSLLETVSKDQDIEASSRFKFPSVLQAKAIYFPIATSRKGRTFVTNLPVSPISHILFHVPVSPKAAIGTPSLNPFSAYTFNAEETFVCGAARDRLSNKMSSFSRIYNWLF